MANAKQFSKFLGSLFLRVLAAALIGTLLLIAVYLLPTGPMNRNLAASAEVFSEEGTYPTVFSWCSSQLDNFTDSIILQNAVYDSGHSAAVQAMTGARGTMTGESDPCEVLVSYYLGNRELDAEEPYYQYWHGYLILIKPLLMLTSYQGIRILNAIVQTGLLAVLIWLLVKKGLKRYILPYIISLLFLMPVTLALSLQFSSCYYILTIGSIALLLMKDRLEEKEAFLFLYIGIATAYFDFLTYPIATFGIPAVLYCCIRGKMKPGETLFQGIKLCFSWGFGYVVMWASKWIIGSIITGQNVLATASAKLTERSASTVADVGLVRSIIDTLYANITTFLRTPATLLLAVLVAAALILIVIGIVRNKPSIGDLVATVFPYFILACLPVVWYLATINHSYIHYWFTGKGLVVSVFAGLCALTDLRKLSNT